MNNLDYGIIGNCKSAALISRDGSIDWCCLPDFDSSSVFAKILDNEKGGYFSIEPIGKYTIHQRYLEKTNILITEYSRGESAFQGCDFMPRYKTDANTYHCPPDIIRYIRYLKGTPKVKIYFGYYYFVVFYNCAGISMTTFLSCRKIIKCFIKSK